MTDRETILVVDDDDAVLELVGGSITRFGYRVLKASDGIAALEIVRQQTPDLVLLDVGMPKMDGLEVCGRIKRLEHDGFIPVILLTGRGSTDDKLKGLDAGADDYLTKPCILGELMARIRSMLRIRKLTQQLKQTRTELIEAKQLAAIAATAVTINDKINTPLTRILVNMEILERKMPEEVRQHCGKQLKDTLDAARMIGTMTKKLARLSRPAMVHYLKDTAMLDLDDADRKEEGGSDESGRHHDPKGYYRFSGR